MKNGKFILLLLIIILFNSCNDVVQQEIALHNKFTPTFSDSIPVSYLKLFKQNVNKNLILKSTLKIKYRPPIAIFILEKKFYLNTYLIDSNFRSSLKHLRLESDYDDGSANSYYSVMDLTNLEYKYKLAMPGKITDVYLNLHGKGTQILFKCDTIAFFRSNFDNLSIRYNKAEDNDIYCKSSVNKQTVPIEIMFLKKNQHLYLLLLSPINRETPFLNETLYNLVN